jgi:hypothetical protein
MHPSFKVDNKTAARKFDEVSNESAIPMQQMDMMNGKLVAMQQQLVHLQERYTELSVEYSVVVQELVGLTNRVVNHEDVLHNVMKFLNRNNPQWTRDSKLLTLLQALTHDPEGQIKSPTQSIPLAKDDSLTLPLKHAANTKDSANAGALSNAVNSEDMDKMLKTLPCESLSSSAPNHPAALRPVHLSESDKMTDPIIVNNDKDSIYGDEILNIANLQSLNLPNRMDAKHDDQHKSRLSTSSTRLSSQSDNSNAIEELEYDDNSSEITDYSMNINHSMEVPQALHNLGLEITRSIILTIFFLLKDVEYIGQDGPSHTNSASRSPATTVGTTSTLTGDSSPSSHSQTGKESHSRDATNSSEGSNSSLKRSRGGKRTSANCNENGQGASDDDGDGTDKRRCVQPSTSPIRRTGPKRKFACPFFKHDAEKHQRWRSCRGPGWDTVHRVK